MMTVHSTADPMRCDFSFVSDAKVRSILEDYFAQAVTAHQADSFLGAVVGCGAVAEGLLTWLLTNRDAAARSARAAHQHSTRLIEEWPLETLVDVAAEIQLFDADVSQLSEAVRHWRNLVHPYRRVRGSPRFDKALALSAFRAVSRMASVAGAQSQTVDVTADEMNFTWFMGQQVAACRGPAAISELRFLAQQGVKGLVRLAKESPVTPSDVSSAGLVDCHVDVPDFRAPSRKQLEKVLNFMTRMVRAGKAVAVSCGAGYGRTGTVLACYLIHEGKTDAEALQYLQERRPASYCEIIERPDSGQLSAIKGYAKLMGRSQCA